MSLPPLPPGFKLNDDKPRKPRSRKPVSGTTRPTGEAHDGDTFRLDTGDNARLYGVDAFELDQTGKARSGSTVPLGKQARDALLKFATPDAVVMPTGAETYGRPVVALDNDAKDAALALLQQGYGIATPQYLKKDVDRLPKYMEAERDARLNRRGAWQTSFEQPSSYRHGTPDPWNPAAAAKPGEAGAAVFWDEALPFQGLRPEIAQGYAAIFQDMKSKPADLMAYAKANGFTIDRADVLKRYAQRAKTGGAGGEVTYKDAPRVLTDAGDGAVGSFARGVTDPLNLLDEAGAVVDSIVPNNRENVWDSDRRFGDIYANNLDQNRSVLAYDDANHPYARFGGQLASGLIFPGASVEGVGFGAARTAMRTGATRFGAKMAARKAVVNRLGTAGAVEGGVAGIGQGETWQDRAAGGLIGTAAGAGLGTLTGYAAPHVAEFIGRPFNKMAGNEGERVAGDFTDGAIDTARARASNEITSAEAPSPTVVERNHDTGRRIIDFASPELEGSARRDIRERRGLSPDEGSYGPIHYKLANPKRWGEAVDKLSKDQSGEVPGAIRHPEIGNVDVVYGSDQAGLARIAADNPDAVKDLPATIERMPVVERPEQTGDGSFVLDDGTHRAVITPDIDGDTKRWILADYAPANTASAGDDVAEEALPPLPEGLTLDEVPVAAPERPTPLLDPATDEVRRPQAADMRPSDVLPLPANTVADVEEAASIDAGRIAPVRAPDETAELSRRNLPSPVDGTRTIPKLGPVDLVTYLRTQGGIRESGGELQHLGIDNAPRKGMEFAGGEQRFGRLVDQGGMGYDEAATRAWEAGYFPDHAEPPTIPEFLDALDATHSGRDRSFLPDDLEEVDRFAAARQQRYDVEAAAQEGDPLYQDRSEPVTEADLDKMSAPVTAYEEWGENAPRLAGNIRLDKLDSPQSIKRALVATHNRVGGFDAATRGRITQAETKALAADLGMTGADLLKRRKGQAFNAEEALAARQILARSSTDLVNMAKRMQRVDVPGEELEAAFKEAWLRHVAIQEQVAGATAEAGRALAAFRIAADSRPVDRVLPSLGDIAGGTTRLKDAADLILENAADPASLNTAIARALKPRFRDKLTELYYNALLSGPATHVVNVVSNTMTALGQLPEHAAAAAIGNTRAAVARRQVDRVLMSEVGARAIGLVQGSREGVRQAARTFITGDPLDAVSKVEQQTMRAIPGPIGSVIRTPTRALAAEDELFKAIARRMELSGLAVRIARTEGLTGAPAKARAAELVANPTDAMLARSFDYGRYLTFQTPLGPVGRKVASITEDMPAFKLILPFVRTPTNILKFAIERSPAAPLLKEWRRDMAKPGPARDLAMAKVMVGTGLAATIYQLAGEGAITGGGPADPGAKALLQADGWQPYSFKVGDKYYGYSRLDPYSSIIGTAADLVELRSHMTDKQRDHTALLVGTAVLHNLSNKTFLSGLSDALGALSDPDQNLEGWLSRMTGALAVPTIVAQVTRATDPVLRDARDPISRIRSRVPGLSNELAKKRDVFGRPIELEGGAGPDVASPVSTTTRRNDPTVKALLDARAHVSKPLRKIGDRDLTDIEYDRYQEVSGRIAKPRLDALVRDGNWLASSDDDKQEAVTELMKTARKEAKAELFSWAAPPPSKAKRGRGRTLPPLPPGLRLDALPPLPEGLTLDR